MTEPALAQQAGIGGYIAQAHHGSSAIVNIALPPPEMLHQLGLMIVERREDAARDARLADLGRQLDVNKEALLGFFNILDVRAVSLETLPQTLAEIAQRHRNLLQRLDGLHPEDPAIRVLIDEARRGIERAD